MNNHSEKTPLARKAVGWATICFQFALPVITPFSAHANQNEKYVHYTNGDERYDQQFAEVASRTGSFFADNPDADAANTMMRSYAASEGGTQAQQWLSQFGTARVQLEVDEKFSLKNSQFDLLVPFYDSQEKIIFSQGSLHRTDDRTQSNLGLGYRQFDNNWMFGLNSFIDYDISRQHTRIGFGAEYWQDFFKFGLNSYHRLTSWRDSPDLEDYQERPANGWDVRAEGWLPAYPQLGGKLLYEQYYGDEVALFGRNNRQQDPRAITAGISYTPIPLFTLSAEQRQGQSGIHDTRFGLEMNYQLGLPWQYQFNTDNVAAMRSLAGSRYDLVTRNNNIVLDYRKKEVISLSVMKNLQGVSGEQKPLNVQVSSKHGLNRIDWTAAEMTAAGGKILSDGSSHSVVFPSWRSGADAVNRYTLHGVAVDSKGNRSARSETIIEVNPAAMNVQNSSLTPIDGALPADGQSQLVMTLNVRDEHQQPIDIAIAEVSVALKATRQAQSATLSAPIRKAAGVFEVSLTSGLQEEALIITPKVQGIALAEVTVNVLKGLPDSNASSMAISTEQGDTSILSFRAKDADGNPISGIADKLDFAVKTRSGSDASSAVRFGPIIETRAGGNYRTTLKASQADAYEITPQYSGVPMNNLTTSINLAGSSVPKIDTDISSFDASPVYVASRQESSTLSLYVVNDQGEPMTGLADSLQFDIKASDGSIAGSRISLSTIIEHGASGFYTATIEGTKADGYIVTPKIDGHLISKLATTVLVHDIPDGARSTLIGSVDQSSPTNQARVALAFTARDAEGNLVNNITEKLSVRVNAQKGSVVSKPEFAMRSTDGVYNATFVASRDDVYTLTMQFEGRDLLGSQPLVLNFKSEVAEVDYLEVNSHNFAVNSGFPTTAYPGASFKVRLKDASPADYDWRVNGAADAVTVDADGVVTLHNSGAAGKDITITATARQGTATATFNFRVRQWFSPTGRKSAASSLPILCDGSNNNHQPELSDMSQGTNVRGVGTLWSEWGDGLPYLMWAKNERSGLSYNSYMNGRNGLKGFFSASNLMDIVCTSQHN
ncbi:inverse autotransporter beta domain-containing protein [Pantoea sp.]|uniref:inverse autotransporter beta domain-containing protein n=1 Tax=Pantoea sp. TaxID=69393 RepID=UPI0031D7F896